jgi:hypothetical protein
MTAAEVLALAKARGVTIKLDGDGLEIIADRQPDRDLLDAIAGCKPQIVAVLQKERRCINRWIASRIITWPSDRCLHCKGPITPGSKWILVAARDDRARFHEPCHSAWLAQQETLARKALGLREAQGG